MENNKRIVWIDLAKAMAIIMVIMGHAIGEYALNFKKLEIIIYSIHIPLFFILSGYTFKVKSDTKRWIINRIKKIMVPYLLFCFCITVCHIMETFILNQDNGFWMKLFSKSGSINTIFLTPKSAFSNLWFLPCLVFAEIILYSILKYVKQSWIRNIVCLLPGLIILLLKINVVLPFSLCTVIVSVMYLYIGCEIKKFIDIKEKNNNVLVISTILYIIAITYDIRVLKCNLEQTMFNLNITYPILFLITSISGSLMVMEICKKLKNYKILNKIGMNTLYIYGFHFIAQNLIKASVYKIKIINRYEILFLVLSTILNLIMCFIGIKILNIIKQFLSRKINVKGEKKMSEKKLNGTVIVTYRCNARCTMCNRYKCPSKPDEDLSIETIKKLPKMYFTNITGGEPFIREDLPEIVRELYKKSDRIVISTNGFFTDRIIALCKEFPNIGIRISIEGLEKTNNEIRGLNDGFNRGYTTLKKLKEMGMKDVGFGMTVQDKNAPDLVPLYKLSNEMDMEFATASLHNSFYFVEAKNIIKDRPMVAKNFEKLTNELLNSKSPKKWFRAYFNHGLINYIYGQKRLLPCDMAFDTFFIDPYGDVMPCNGTKDKEVMGNLNEQNWDELWNSEQAENVRNKVRHCDRNCWMIGSVSPAMHKYILKPATWVLGHKLRFWTKKKYSMYENKIVRDLRDGKVTKEELDNLSTCDMNAVVNNGLSEKSKEQLKSMSGEDIVDADIAKQYGKVK